MHLCNTRPDIIFSVHKLAQFLSKPYVIHESALYRVFGYVKYTISFGIKYGGEQIYADLDYFTLDHNIIGYADTSKKGEMQAVSYSDHASDPTDRKSIRGFVFILLGEQYALTVQNKDLLPDLQQKLSILHKVWLPGK